MIATSSKFPYIMTVSHSRSRLSRRLKAGVAALALCSLAGCKTDDLLEVDNPDILPPGGLLTASGTGVLRSGAIQLFYNAFGGIGDNVVVISGNLADEIIATDTFDGRNLPNRRSMNDNLPELLTPYLALHKARTNLTTAITTLQTTLPNGPKFNVSEMYIFRGLTEDFFGELYCSGVPFSKDDGVTRTYGMPQTTTQIFNVAAASLDSALSLADTSVQMKYFAQVAKGRVLLNLGKFSDARDAVLGVPTSFKRQAFYSLTTQENGVYNSTAAANSRYGIAKNEGMNGLDFLPCGNPACTVTGDARLPWVPSTRTGFNAAFTNQPTQTKQTRTGPITIADGVEARLIEAEARLQGGTQADRDAVFALLNTLRATGFTTVIAALPGTAPTTQAAAVTQLFNERAYWLFLTGHRLGDLRRLIRQYGRDPETVFPTGALASPGTGTYGTDVNFIIPSQEKNNPNFTGCLDRKA